MCHVCQEADVGDTLLLCDSCDNACHLGCAAPALSRIPKGDWFCVECREKSEKAAAAAAAAAEK